MKDIDYKKVLKYIFNLLHFTYQLVILTIGSIIKISVAFVLTLTVGFTVGAIIGVAFYFHELPTINKCMTIAYDKISNMQEGDFKKGQDTYIYDKNNNVIGILNAGHFEYVTIEHISDNIQNLYISQEDKRFKQHNGVDIQSTARAGLALLKHQGAVTQGGSTITQQVVKNTYLTQEKSYIRKLTEMLIAVQLEQKVSKPKIMEYYCNTNYYANGCYGVQAASKYYFNKKAEDLNIAEAALLVGLSNSPSTYDPVAHPEAALEKRNEVIDNAVKNGFITEEQGELAKNEPINPACTPFPENKETYGSTYAVQCAALALMQNNGFEFKYTFDTKEEQEEYQKKYSEAYEAMTSEIRTGGYSIYTSIDPKIQEKAQKALDDGLVNFTEIQDNGKYALQGAMAIADNKTGYIVAIIGGRGTDDQFNRAYLSARQPGSSIKPLIDYTPAFDTGEYYAGSIINDHEWENGPKNSGGSYRGDIAIREAVNRSLNTVAWQVLEHIGIKTGLNYLGEMNFHKLSYIDSSTPAISIGGFTNGVRVVDMVKGYQTLANNGVYSNKTCIIKLLDRNGKDIMSSINKKDKQVYDADAAYMITSIMKDTIEQPYGTAYGLGLKNMPAAGKTGTTNESKDTWFSGYTKYYTTTVWVGYDTPRPMPHVYGATYAGKIWQNIMNQIHEELEPEDWTQPDTITEGVMEGGLPDLVSSVLEQKKTNRITAAQDEKYKEKIRKQVEEYEISTIGSVKDALEIDVNYNEIAELIGAIADSSFRSEMMTRILNKRDELYSIRDGMTEEIKEYEREETERKRLEAERIAKENEERRKKEQLNLASNAFENAIKELHELKYQDADIMSKIDSAYNRLQELQIAESRVNEYESAKNYYNGLPTEEAYNNSQKVEETAPSPINNNSNEPVVGPYVPEHQQEYGPGTDPSIIKNSLSPISN